jgi:phosphoenolpyruvate carboxykinase (GTP)
MRGLNISEQDIEELLSVDMKAWKVEIPNIEKHFAQFGDRLPERLKKQLEALKERLG